MSQKFSNKARSSLTGNVASTDTSFSVVSGDADLFPVATTGTSPVGTTGLDYFKVVLEKSTGAYEIVYVRTRASGAATMTNVIRGQEGTTALAFSAGDIVGLRVTTADIGNAIAGIFANITASVLATLQSLVVTAASTLNGLLTVNAGAFTASKTPAFSATPTFDASTSNVFEPGALTANITAMTISNPNAGQTILIRFVQDATGGRTVALPTGAAVTGSINATASKASWLSMTYSAAASRWEGAWMQLP